MLLNVTVIVARAWGLQYREELILNYTEFVVRAWGGQYREELLLNVTVFFVMVWGRQYRGTDTECHCDCCGGLWRAIERGRDTE